MDRRRSGTRLFLAAVAVALAATVIATPATAQPADEGGRAEPEGRRPEGAPGRPSSEDLNEAAAEARSKGKARVMVGLRTSFRPEGEQSSSGRQAQRSEIAMQQRDVRADLAGTEHRVRHEYETIPFIALEVSEAAVKRLGSSDDVASVELVVPHRPTLAESSPLVEADDMWTAGSDGDGTVVAVLDTGVDNDHSFFGGRVVAEACFSTNAGTANDSLCPNGQETDTAPDSGENCSTSLNGCNHGTHVAGIAAGSGPDSHGVARGADIMAVQVFTEVTGSACGPGPGASPCTLAYNDDITAAMEHVYSLRTTHSFASLNLSLSGGAYTAPCDSNSNNLAYKSAIDNLLSVGIATVAATGNDGLTDTIGSPACVSTAVAVGSTTKSDVVASSSNGHPTMVDLLAPGSSIRSSVPGGGFAFMGGTSMASPHVAGAYALLKQRFPEVGVLQALDALQSTGLPVTDSRDSPSFTTPRIRIAQAADSLDGVVYEVLNVPEFSVVSPADGGSPVTFTIPGGVTEPGEVMGFSFKGTVSGVGATTSWASDTCMRVEAPDGTSYTVGGYDAVDPECELNPWDFDGEGSSVPGTYESQHGNVFSPPVGDQGDWTLTFSNDFDDVSASTIHWSNVTVTLHKIPPATSLGDYDGDGDTDIAIFRPSNGWWRMPGQPIIQFGTSGDVPVPADYDGDGDTDIAVFRPSNGRWYVKDHPSIQWGISGDVPVPGDYNGDGDTDIAIFRPSNGWWRMPGQPIIQFGTSGDVPVPGDYDGDGDTDIAVFRPSNGRWYVKDHPSIQWGISGDVPVPGDYDGDGDTDIAIFRPSNGWWRMPGQPIIQFGTSGDVPVPGDYDGDGDTDIAVFRPSNGRWYVNGQPSVQWGIGGDIPLSLPSVIYERFF